MKKLFLAYILALVIANFAVVKLSIDIPEKMYASVKKAPILQETKQVVRISPARRTRRANNIHAAIHATSKREQKKELRYGNSFHWRNATCYFCFKTLFMYSASSVR